MSSLATRLHSAMQLVMQGKAADAKPTLLRLAQQAPDHPDVLHGVALACLMSNDAARGEYYVSKALQLSPRVGTMHNTHAQIMVALGKAELAEKSFHRALELDPTVAPAWLGLANIELGTKRPWLASRTILKGLAPTNSMPALVGPAAVFQLIIGHADEAVALAAPIAARNARDVVLTRNLAVASNFAAAPSPQDIFAHHLLHGRAIQGDAPPTAPTFANTRDAERTLRVGILSPDLRRHSVAYFLEPLLAATSRQHIEWFAYSNLDTRVHDSVTARLKPHFTQWRDVLALTDEQAATAMVKDRIDVLIDLAGLTDGGRASLVARHPAPVVVTYLGYANTTGLRGLDARIIDSITDPAGSEALATEPLVRLDPTFLCFAPPPEAPPVSPLPDGPIVFGSFNALAKLTDSLLNTWARVIDSTPGSILMLKAQHLADADLRADLLARCVAAGLPADRVRIVPPPETLADHLAAYAQVHIALDTFPFAGTTTTCEAMWMGVPVVTLRGKTHAARVGASLLSAACLPDLIASEENSYIALACSLARDRQRLSTLRSTLRDQLHRSPLCDAPAFAQRFESALRTLWRSWCTKTAGAV